MKTKIKMIKTMIKNQKTMMKMITKLQRKKLKKKIIK